MRLLFIASQYPPLTGGGASRIYDFARIISSKGHSCFVVTYVPLRSVWRVRLYELQQGVHILRLPSVLPRNPVDQIIPLLFIVLGFGLFRRCQAVLMSLPSGEPAIGAYLGAKLSRMNTVFDVRDEWEDAIIRRRRRGVKLLQYGFYKMLFSGLYSKANLVIGVTPALIRSLQARGASKTLMIPNGADTNLFKPMERDSIFLQEHPNIARDDFIIIYAGHVGWYYRLDIVIQAIQKLIHHPGRRLKFTIMGDGEKLGEYMELANKLGLGGDVIFTGDVPRREVATVMNRCDLGVIPYDDDTLWMYAYPTKIFEHCASGLPTVVSIVGGSELEKLVNWYGFGIVTKPLDVEDFVNAIEKLLTNSTLRNEMRQAALQASFKFSRQETAEQLLQAVDEGL